MFTEIEKKLVNGLLGYKTITFGIIFSTGQQLFASLPEKLYMYCPVSEPLVNSNSKVEHRHSNTGIFLR